jgi:hypothetical protein
MIKGKLLSLLKIVAMVVLTIVVMCMFTIVIFIQAFPKDPRIEKPQPKYKINMSVTP